MRIFMKTAILLPLCLLLGVAFPWEARSAELPAGTGVRITADTLGYDQKSESYEAKGNVNIRWDGTTLTADSAEVRQRENDAVAGGNVVLRRGSDLLRADRLTVNYATDLGEVENGDLFTARGNFHVRGRRMAKLGIAEYHLDQGAFTTCDGPDPSWQFTATDLDVTLEGYARGKNAVFHIGSLPVFYLPYIVFPVKEERQSGFLFPRIGSSTLKGFVFDLPYYWAISPSQDATFDLDVQTRRGVGIGSEYRYQLGGGSRGTLRSYYIYDTSAEKSRGELTAQIIEGVTPTVTVRSDARLVLDRTFFHDYGETAGDYNRQLVDSSLSVTKSWQPGAAAAEVRYLEDLYAADNRATLQRFPTLSGSIVGRRLGETPLYASLDADYTHFERDAGIAGERLDLRPRLTLAGPALAPLHYSLWGGYRLRLYDGYGATTPGVAGRGYNGDGLADAGALLGTELDRVYPLQWGELRRLKHTLVPELSYTFVQERDQTRLPQFDYNDRVVGGSLLGWSLSSYMTGRFQRDDALPEYRDLLFLRLSQGYQLSGGRRDLLTLVDTGRPWTDLRLEARFTPVKRVSLTTDSRFNPYEARFSTSAVAVDVKDDHGNTLGAGFHYIPGSLDYLEGSLGVALVKPFVFHYTGRYAVDTGTFLESYYTLEYKRQCWSVTFSYRDLLAQGVREFFVSFNLMGIGALGPVRAF
jgi:LPS-assembly protein